MNLGYLSGAPRVSTQPWAETTGARAHVLGVMNGFKKHGWEIHPYIVGDLVPKEWSSRGSQRLISKGLFTRLAADTMRIAMRKRHSSEAFRKLASDVDWVYERFGAFQALGGPFQKTGIPWILETNGPLFLEAAGDRKSMALTSVAKRLEIDAYQACDVVVCISNELKEILVERAHVPSRKIVVVPNGVDADQFNPDRHLPQRAFAGFTVGMVGNLYAWAGTDLLIDAVYELRNEGVDISAVIVGDGVTRHELGDKVHELGIQNAVKFAGRVPWNEVPSHILGFDIAYSGQVTLTLGKMYHSPLKLYEYMAAGRPVIASSFEDASRILEEGVTGFLFDPGSKTSLKDKLREAYEGRISLRKMGERARETMLRDHTWKQRVGAIIEGSQSILDESHS